jgi:hypothetical protein
MRSMSRGAWLGGACLAIAGLILAMGVGSALSQPPEDPSFKAETPPPEGQKYIGSKKCSSCHFDQFMTWKKSKHGKEAWETLPAKYRTDAECIKCHATGVGRETGFTSFEETPGLAGVSCEACHGPGSAHADICKPFANKKKLSDDELKTARDSIWKIVPHNVCVSCHMEQNHKQHPKYDKAK